MSVSFDKKLAELDAYLQMLISENEALDKKLIDHRRLSTSTINSCENEVENIVNIKNNLEKLLSSIKHAIVLLQIARVSSRSSSISLSYSGSGSSADTKASPSSLREKTTPSPLQWPPRRPSRSPKLTTASSSRLAGGSKSAATATSTCAESNEKSATVVGRQIINDNNLAAAASAAARQNQIQQEQQLAPQANTTTTAAAAAASAKLQQLDDHIFTPSHPSPQLHDITLRGSEAATPNATTAAAAAVANNNNNSNVASNLKGEGIEDEDDDDADFFDAADEQQQQQQQILHNHSKSIITDSSPSSSGRLLDDLTHPNSPKTTTTTTTLISTPANTTTKSIVVVDDNNTYTNHQDTREITTQGTIVDDTMSETNNNNRVDSTMVDGDGSIDWDALYDEEDDDELGSMEGQGSMIKHLLSQIRIGMDLTKVVLPTFILERRSLLEMYADFFAHPDLFSTIPDFSSPEERMIQLVRWYLSAFHAGRKSSLAKKPYNPILGEIFKCQWKMSSDSLDVSSRLIDNSNGNSKQKNGDSIEQQKQQQQRQEQEQETQNLTFVAEQVSHHPPVSAFYAENKEKGISCCAHIYTKSKYLGLSVGVHNVGQGVINLSKHNETYTCTFPSAYGRSILTIPWVELGGPVTITCEQTGFKANIEFLMKPFYGGKKHRVTGEILRPNNEPILSIDGEWNGIMYSKSPRGSSSDKKVFVDTTNLPVIKKHVKPVSAQESFESRNVWKEVTRALKMKDVNSATAAKSYIEQRQRDLLKDRQDQGIKWKTRYFEASGDDSWTYSTSSSDSGN